MSYPHSLPHASGMLDVDGNASLYWEESGNPAGEPALWLHGGPGGSLENGGYRTFFDPTRYRIIGIEQRGSGRSTPTVREDRESLRWHTTQQLIADIEAVRAAFGIKTWLVAGVSWGTTLGLAYAEAHPDRVRALALMAVTTTSRDEVDWLTEGVGRIFPEEWAVFERASDRHPGERVVDAYARRLASSDAEDREAAARAWDLWENVHVSLDHPELRGTGYKGEAAREAFATLVSYYWSNDAFLPGGSAVLDRLDRIAHIPVALVHGRRDISSPLLTAWRLHRALPMSTLTVIEGEAHGGAQGNTALTAALDAFI